MRGRCHFPRQATNDVTVEIADELRQRYNEFGEVPDGILDFIEAYSR